MVDTQSKEGREQVLAELDRIQKEIAKLRSEALALVAPTEKELADIRELSYGGLQDDVDAVVDTLMSDGLWVAYQTLTQRDIEED